MGREKELFRYNLELVKERWPKAELIPQKEVAAFLGISYKAICTDKQMPFQKVGGRYYITPAKLASWLS